MGGHSESLLNKTSPQGNVLGIDRDTQALRIAEKRLQGFKSRISLVHGTFDRVRDYIATTNWGNVDGMLLDLGLSSLQIEDPERGFSFKKDSVLDMRMDLEEEVTARELLNNLPEKDLEAIFREYGEERYSKRIARHIVRNRQREPMINTGDLRNLISRAVPFFKNTRIHPATRVFQALRIAVNRELNILEKFLKEPPDFLKVGGVLVVLSYHSLEDRIVKHAFKRFENYKILTKKPLRPSTEEIRRNRRSRSAKLRAIQRVE